MEHELRSDHQVAHRLGHGHLGRAGERGDPCADVHREAADLVADPLDLAGVHASAHFETERSNGFDNRGGAVDGAGGSVERGEEPVPGCVDLDPAIAGQERPHRRMMALDKLAPSVVAERRRPLG